MSQNPGCIYTEFRKSIGENKPNNILLFSFYNYFEKSLKVLLWFQVNNNKKGKIISNETTQQCFINATLDQGKPKKNEISDFKLVSILNTSAKIYEKVIKDQLVSGLERYFSPFISAYRKRYCTQHVLIRLVEEWRE